MHDSASHSPLEYSTFFTDGRASRAFPEGAVARGQLREDTAFHTGKVKDQAVTAFPFPVTREIVKRGQERFNIYCAPCHDRLGNGLGMIVRRGYRRPPSFHTDRLREIPVGHIYDVITNGFGAMPDYSTQVSPQDRWAIVAYVRALQLSQQANVSDVPPEGKSQLDTGGTR